MWNLYDAEPSFLLTPFAASGPKAAFKGYLHESHHYCFARVSLQIELLTWCLLIHLPECNYSTVKLTQLNPYKCPVRSSHQEKPNLSNQLHNKSEC